MLLGDARTRGERGLDIEKTEHRVLDGERICDERTANRRGARFEAYGKGQIRESEERPLIHYIGRNTHRIANSNSRLIKIEDDRVYFNYKDYRADGKWKQCHLKAEDFIKRFLMHVLPKGFHRIRHYGFLSNRRSKAKVARIRNLLCKEDDLNQLKQKVIEDHAGLICPVCAKGRLTPIMIVHRMGVVIKSVASVLSANRLLWDTS
ncbi:Transposase [Olavius sp. associated proteobacterium Delta 1]|nr:Transposase [Olavius sp. associated proteobacterium Delta 1]